MKENWERAEAPVTLELPEIAELVAPLFRGKRVTAAERIGIGLSNSNYKLELEGMREPYVLRLYRGDENVAAKERDIARLLRGTVPVPDILYADWSRTRYKSPWAVVEWREGALLRDVIRSGNAEQIASAAASAGAVLARIHSYRFPAPGFFGPNLSIAHPFAMDADNFLSFMEHSLFEAQSGVWLGEELKQAVWSMCRRCSPLISQREEPPVLVHSDFNGLNILVRCDSSGCSVSAVLDWEFAFAGSGLVDIANMLRYEPRDSALERHFIRAYIEHGGTLPSNWRLLSKLDDLIALCDMLNGSMAQTPNRINDLRRLIAATVQAECQGD
ncbi:aminoglycoside phosphotransferase [Gordoniibacillus kamchatkensis]|uniref:Aminoglycoside phosphotransferase n=1 Tax=Gordoniibacillus kamchatkensis TaxID=1590651 RepID=A0ABR5AIU7_9BACL|nr:aminoglycoside phosphotransferase family protein [Paenibacillus sp. VKM B-2647]KIL40944.1 aminoglycoside phosphotransferase [Paenibacillus sp. VKM B-2647]